MSTYIHATIIRLLNPVHFFFFLVSVHSFLFCNHLHNCDWVERSKGETTGWMLKEADGITMKKVVTHARSIGPFWMQHYCILAARIEKGTRI